MLDFTILLLDRVYAVNVALTLDALAMAQKLANRYSAAPPRWKVCSVHGGNIETGSGLLVATQKLELADDDKSIWIIPGLGFDNPDEVHARLLEIDAMETITLLGQHVDRGGIIAASCSSVFLLQRAGLLKHRRVTTAWSMTGELMRLEPDCKVDDRRLLCEDGPIITAGAAFSHANLMLHLLRPVCGEDVTAGVCQVLFSNHHEMQASYAITEAFSYGEDLIGRVVRRIEAALPDAISVGDLAAEFCMSERTLTRHIQKATGKNTMTLMQGIKQRRARSLLESSRMSVEQVAAAVGYQDATALRRLMKKISGTTPSRFRQATVCV